MDKLIQLLEQFGFYRTAAAVLNGSMFASDTEMAVVDVLKAWAAGNTPLTCELEGLSDSYRSAEQTAIEYVDSFIAVKEAETNLQKAKEVLNRDDPFMVRRTLHGDSTVIFKKVVAADRKLMTARELLRADEKALKRLAKNLPMTTNQIFPLQKP